MNSCEFRTRSIEVPSMKSALCSCLLIAGIPLIASAQGTGADPAKVLAPYVDELTYAVGVLDVQNIDIDGFILRLAKAGASMDDVAAIKAAAMKAESALRAAGVNHVFFALNLADPLADGPLLVIA